VILVALDADVEALLPAVSVGLGVCGLLDVGVRVGLCRGGALVEVVPEAVVVEGGGVVVVLDELLIGSSPMIERSVSAATIPPMLCPTRITRTEGSTVGAGVPAATSISMTWFWSLHSN